MEESPRNCKYPAADAPTLPQMVEPHAIGEQQDYLTVATLGRTLREGAPMSAIALITGASSGLGRELVRQVDNGAAGHIDEIWVVARRRGLIILTDSDGAGFVIRNYLKGALPKEQVLHAYIPDIFGKERRKRQAGKEGKLGVEGMTPEILLAALRDAGAHIEGETAQAAGEPITKLDLFELGLSGTADSSERRAALKRELSLPEHLSANGLLDALNVLFRREEFLERYKRSNP